MPAKYAVFDNETGEWLESYVKDDCCTWNGDPKPRELELFSSREEAQEVINDLNARFLKSGIQPSEIDFGIVKVREVRLTYYERTE